MRLVKAARSRAPEADGRVPLTAAWALFAAALPLSIAGSNMASGLALLALAWAATRRAPPLSAMDSASAAAWTFYVAAAAAASLASPDPGRGVTYLIKDLHKIALWALVAAGAAAAGPRAGGPVAWALGGSFAAAALVGIGQAAGGWSVGEAPVRAHAFVHAVTFGEQQAFAVLGFFAVISDPAFRNRPRARKAAWAGLALCSTALLLSQTRGAATAAAVGLAAAAFAVPRLRRAAAAAVPAAAAMVVAADWLGPGNRSVLRYLLGLETTSSQWYRLEFWSAAWRMFLDHPWFGVGPGLFREAYPRYVSATLDGERTVGNAHNLFFHHLAERGAIGLLALAALFAFFLSRSWRLARARPDAFGVWAFGASVAFLVMNLTETAFQTEQIWMLFLFLWTWPEAMKHARQT